MRHLHVVPTLPPVLLAGVLVLLPAGGLNGPGPAGPLVRLEARGSVSGVAARLRQEAKKSGFVVMGRLDQGEALSTAADTVESRSYFIGDPRLGRELFGSDPGVGAAFPLRVNVYRDGRGHTYISYLKPSSELRSYGSLKIDKIAKMLDQKIHHIATSAAS